RGARVVGPAQAGRARGEEPDAIAPALDLERERPGVPRREPGVAVLARVAEDVLAGQDEVPARAEPVAPGDPPGEIAEIPLQLAAREGGAQRAAERELRGVPRAPPRLRLVEARLDLLGLLLGRLVVDRHDDLGAGLARRLRELCRARGAGDRRVVEAPVGPIEQPDAEADRADRRLRV